MHDDSCGEAGSLVRQLLARPQLAAAVEQAVSDAEKEARSRGSGEGLAEEESRLRALQLFDYATGTPPGTRRDRHDYRRAAAAVRERGNARLAGILDWFAILADNGGSLGWSEDHLFDADVEPYHRRWNARHRQWAGFAGIDLARLPAGPVREHGRGRRGTDGAVYTRATCEGLPGGPRPAVVVRVSPARAEVVTFASRETAADWLARRLLGGDGPLPVTADGPACRAAREEEVLARLLQAPDDAQIRALVNEAAFSSHLRAELFRVLAPDGSGRPPEPGQARFTFEWNMLRAPGWALPVLGWPHPHRAMRYLARLEATPVTPAQAHAAAQALAAGSWPGPAIVPGPRRESVPARRGPGLPVRQPRQDRAEPAAMVPPPLPGAAGTAPRR